MQMDKIIQIASIVFSTLALIVTASFFVGGNGKIGTLLKIEFFPTKAQNLPK